MHEKLKVHLTKHLLPGGRLVNRRFGNEHTRERGRERGVRVKGKERKGRQDARVKREGGSLQ